MLGHAIILMTGFSLDDVVGDRLCPFSALFDHLVDDLVILINLLLFGMVCPPNGYRIVGSGTRTMVVVVDGLVFMKPFLFTIETGCATNMVNFNQNHIIPLLIRLINRLYYLFAQLVCTYSWRILCTLLNSWSKIKMPFNFVLLVKSSKF